MPRLLIVKTSSMGDVVHCLPVVNDIRAHVPAVEIEWLAEEAFAEIPRMHPGVARVIPMAWRRWRRSLLDRRTRAEIRDLHRTLHDGAFDFVLDLQGLLKSALFGLMTTGTRLGLDRKSAWEPLASLTYHRRFSVPPTWHAVDRYRQLAAQAFDYTAGPGLDYGLSTPEPAPVWLPSSSFAVLLTATSRPEKLWPEADWARLGQAFHDTQMLSVLPSGSAEEELRARRIAEKIPGSLVAPRMNLTNAAAVLGRACVVVGVDTGLLHLASGLGTPAVGIYCGSSPAENGVRADTPHSNLGGPGLVPDLREVTQAVLAVARR